jgi:tetratricopeptide (TPR) repeat protein
MMLETTLNQLETSELVRRLHEEDLAYLFKHALVQDTAQESLLKQERKRLHRLVGETLEMLYVGRLDEMAARLAQHYDAAGMVEKTIGYAERAGDMASQLSAHAEAIDLYARAFALAQTRADETSDSSRLKRLMTSLGRAYELAANYDQAIAVYRSTLDFATARADQALELAALVQLAKVLAVAAMRYDPKQSQAICDRALELARALDDHHAQARVLWTMMLLNLYGAGGAHEGVRYGEQSLALARALNWREQMAFTLNDLFYTYLNLGEMVRARECADEARALWRELDNKPMLTDSLNAAAMGHIMHGEFEDALGLLQESRAVCEKIGNRWGESTSYMIEGYAQTERGDFVAARAAFEACMRSGDPINVHGPIVMARYELARMYALFGRAEAGLEYAREALERTRQFELDWNAWAYATLAFVHEQSDDWNAADTAVREIVDAPPEYHFERMLPSGGIQVVLTQIRYMMRHGQWVEAREHLTQLLERVERSDLTVFVPTVLCQWARLEIAQGEFERARMALDQAHVAAETLDLRFVRLEIARTRLDLEMADGKGEMTETARCEAQTALEKMLPFIPIDLQPSFLQTPFVTGILHAA